MHRNVNVVICVVGTLLIFINVLIIIYIINIGKLKYKQKIINSNNNFQVIQNILKSFPEKNQENSIPDINLSTIFQSDHSWIATLSSENVRTIIATGDIIPARSVNFQTVSRNDFLWPYKNISEITKNADFTIANLESPLIRSCPLTNDGMIFCGDRRNVEGLVYAGIDAVNLANNHSTNYGREGIIDTENILTSNKIVFFGTENLAIINIRGLTVGLLGFNNIGSSGGLVQEANLEKIKKDIDFLKNITDIIIVSYHWGTEYTDLPTGWQKELARRSIEYGADLVIGNHPHWIQPVEVYQGKVIMYAHGNFIFDQMWSDRTEQGVIGKYVFYNTKLIDVQFIPIIIRDYGQAQIPDVVTSKNIIDNLKNNSIEL